MRAFAEQHPEIELTLDVGNAEYVFERVLGHTADLAICGRPPADPRLAAEPLATNEIVCITTPDDPVCADGPVDAAVLADRAWLMREPGSGSRKLNEQFLADRGLTPRTLVLGSNGAIKQAARAGLGVSLVSRAAVETELASGRLAEITAEQRSAGATLVRVAIDGRPRQANPRAVRGVRAGGLSRPELMTAPGRGASAR